MNAPAPASAPTPTPAGIEIRAAEPRDAAAVAQMACALTDEISQRLGVQHFALEAERSAKLCAGLLAAGRYGALLAWHGSQPLGFAGFSESFALYAEGAFATIQEFYVHPDWRSRGIGAALIAATARLAQERGWRRLELCTPPLPDFQRSLDFYAAQGFEVTGGRKMKRVP